MNRAFLSLGTNMGDRELNLETAIKCIVEKVGDCKNLSHMYETEPWGFDCNLQFLNMVLEINTELSPNKLLKKCLMIEKEIGRKRSDKPGYEARIIDIDILFYEDFIISNENLVVPHPYIQLRKFILEPLMEISPDFIHPMLNKKISELNLECEDKGQVRIFETQTSFIRYLLPDKGNR